MRIVAAVLLLALTTWATHTRADLGDKLAQAKARSGSYKSQFGAVAPLFKTDSRGRVVWECWAAPPKQWTKDQAFALVKQLVPAETASRSPKRLGVDGTQERYVYPDGTVAILQVFRGSYFGVEVHVPNYSGTNC